MKTEDIIPVTGNIGEVKLIQHSGTHMEIALVLDMLSQKHDGTTCILTSTNHEALLLLGLLREKKIPAKLIQSMEGFDLMDIMEIRYFRKKLGLNDLQPTISDEQWNHALEQLRFRYAQSECLEMVLRILHTFAENHPRKYRTDFELFLHESKHEDFQQTEQGHIMISTLHKAKGREFDRVYILLNKDQLRDDAELRALYVGITRAKKLLHIHYCGDVMNPYAENGLLTQDALSYPQPNELIMQLSHRDVFLDYFKDKKQLILTLRSGMSLSVKGNRLYATINGKSMSVLQFSAACYERIKKLIDNGYIPYTSKIRYICAWMGKEDTTESAIILADLYFRRDS